jgi:molybdopterin converting factor small subunit
MDLRWCLVAVNGVRVGPRTRLRDGDVVSFFPAAAGG